MSMLLEALRKSEQQRRLGATPTLQTPVDEVAAEDDRLQHWLPLVLMAVSVIAIAWFGWQQYRPPDPAGAGALPGRPPAGEQVTRAAPTAGPASGAPVEAAESVRQPDPVSGDRERTPVESFQAAADTAAQSEAEAGTRPAAEQQDQPEELQEAPQAEPAITGREAPENEMAETEPPALVESPDPASRSPVEPHESAPLSYWELPQSVRDDLPEFRITVLVYADQPEDRFLLMGGQRLVENETVDGGLVLEEIRRDGAVFRYRKYLFLVKR